MRRQLAALALGGSGGLPAAEGKKLSDQLQGELERIEGQRGTVLTAPPVPTLSQVLAALPPDAALVDIEPTVAIDLAAAATQLVADVGPIALILRRDRRPAWVDLGKAKLWQDDVKALRRNLALPSGQVDELAHKVYQRVFAPLQSHLTGASELIVVPDMPLHLLPWAVLQAPDGKRLADLYAIRYLDHPRALLTPASAALCANIAETDRRLQFRVGRGGKTWAEASTDESRCLGHGRRAQFGWSSRWRSSPRRSARIGRALAFVSVRSVVAPVVRAGVVAGVAASTGAARQVRRTPNPKFVPGSGTDVVWGTEEDPAVGPKTCEQEPGATRIELGVLGTRVALPLTATPISGSSMRYASWPPAAPKCRLGWHRRWAIATLTANRHLARPLLGRADAEASKVH